MQAVILAAGVGRRFEPEPLEHPKCLLEFGGKSLLARSIENLQWAGCEMVTVVVGYRAEMIEREVASWTGKPGSSIQTAVRYNPNYEGGSAGSVLVAADVFEGGPTLMLDADVLYDRRMLTRLIASENENVLAVDAKTEQVTSEYWLTGSATHISGVYVGTCKFPTAVGVYWGVHKFSPAGGKLLVELAREAFRREPKIEYWHVVPQLFDKIVVGTTDIGDYIFFEMDTWQELEQARKQIYPQLVALGQA
jgi:choline kinase